MKNWFRAATALAASAVLWIQPVLALDPGSVPIVEDSGIGSIVAAIDSIVSWMLAIAGILAVAYLVYAGIQYIIGGTKGAEAAKGQIVSAVTGIIIIILSYVIVKTVFSLMT